MADNTTLNSGTGGDTVASDDISGVKFQRVKLTLGADGVNDGDVSSSNALPVSDNGSTLSVDDGGSTVSVDDGGSSLTVDGTVGVSGTVTVDSELTTADLDTGAGTDTRAVVGVVLAGSGGASNLSANSGNKDGGTVRVVLATDQPALTNKLLVTPDLPSGAATSAKQDTGNTSLSSIDGKITAVNTGAVVVSSSALPSGAATAAKQPALGTAGSASSDVLTIQGIASMTKLLVTPDANSAVNVAQMNGTTVAMGTGTRSSGTQRVTIATDDVVPASQSGTWTVQPGNTANTTPWLTTPTPATSGGLTTAMFSGSDGSSILVATAQVVKASAGQLYGYYVYNPEAAVTFVHFYNTAAASVTVGTTNPLFTLAVPAGSAANMTFPMGVTFSNAGWSVAATTTAGGNTAPSTGASLVVWYK